MTEYVDLIVAIHLCLDDAGIPHAFGGALALGIVATPRGTVDIDLNTFVTPGEMGRVEAAVGRLGYRRDTPTDALPIAGIRFVNADDPFPLDVFPSLDPAYDEIERRVVTHEFGRGGDSLPFLSAEDLCIFKLSFGRPQDWVDLAAIARARPSLDTGYIERQLIALRGPSMYPRVARLRGLVP